MIQNVWRKSEAYNRLRIVGIKDTNSTPWNMHVLETIKKEQPDKPVPDVVYVGVEREYLFFKNDIPNVVVCSRTTQNFPFLSGNMVRDMIALRDERYKEFVHPENIELVEKNFYEDKTF
jgi:hypothetical protein